MGNKVHSILALISILLAFPGFILVTGIPPYNVIGWLCLFIAFLLFIFWWVLNLPLWTILQMEKKVIIRYSGGLTSVQKVQLVKKTKMRANHKGISEFIHRNIRSDGTIKGFILNNSKVSSKDVVQRVGEYYIYERFKPMSIWQKKESELIIEAENTYPNSTEFTSYKPDFVTKKIRIEINFPDQKPARQVRAYCCIGAETKELITPTLSSDGLKCRWEGNDLRPGKDYFIEWHW